MNRTMREKDEGAAGAGAEDRMRQGSGEKMRTLLICQEGADLDHVGLARWLASFSELRGIVVLREKKSRLRRRVRREVKRVGLARFLDVLAFRLYYKLFLAASDLQWERAKLAEMCRAYEDVSEVPVLLTDSPNSSEAEQFIRERGTDIMLARCKTLLTESVFSLPAVGAFVMHPGTCPEYRNAHGCFWALANDDMQRVGMTLLRIDNGVDTGPVYGYYSYNFDERNESHIRIQHRVVLENLNALEKKLMEIYRGEATPLDVEGRTSATWGQPWLSSYLKLKRKARASETLGNGSRAPGEAGSRRLER